MIYIFYPEIEGSCDVSITTDHRGHLSFAFGGHSVACLTSGLLAGMKGILPDNKYYSLTVLIISDACLFGMQCEAGMDLTVDVFSSCYFSIKILSDWLLGGVVITVNGFCLSR